MLKPFKLKNGAQVATYNLPNVRSFHFKVTAKGGSILESKKTHGLAHFMEHMLLQGIPSFPTAETLSEYIEGLAGTYNAGTGQYSINFHITVPLTHIEDAVKISSEVFFESLFPQNSLEKERRAILEEVRQQMDSTGYKLSQFFKKTRFRKECALTRTGGGDPTTIAKLTRDSLVDYWQTNFLPKNTYLLAIGKFSESQLGELLGKYFGRYGSNKKFAGLPKFDPDDLTNRVIRIRYDTKLKSNYIDLSFGSLSAEQPLKLRLQQTILLTILSNLSRSRLFKLLRHQLGIVYGISAGSYTTEGLGYVNISSETSRENLNQLVTLVTHELSVFVKNGPTDEELKVAIEYLSNRWLMSFDHPASITGWVENDLLWEDRIRLPEEVISLVKDTTVDELVELMQKHWDFSKLNLTIQGGVKNTKENVAKFSKLLEPLT